MKNIATALLHMFDECLMKSISLWPVSGKTRSKNEIKQEEIAGQKEISKKKKILERKRK
jgi:hypothetical protein